MHPRDHTQNASFAPLGVFLSVLLSLCSGFVMGSMGSIAPGNMPYALALSLVLLTGTLLMTRKTLSALDGGSRSTDAVAAVTPASDSAASTEARTASAPIDAPSAPTLEPQGTPDPVTQEDTDSYGAEPVILLESEPTPNNSESELDLRDVESDLVQIGASASRLDYASFADKLTATNDPIGELKLFVGDIRTREAGEGLEPSPYERYAARRLSEAGLFDREVELPQLHIVRPKPSHMLYLRVTDHELSYLAKIRILSIEAALNALRLSNDYFDDPNDHNVREHYQLIQRLTASITAQSPNLSEHV